jgi:uncharacterized iron-regulated protein
MYQSNSFNNFLATQSESASSYCSEFEHFDDKELLAELRDELIQMNILDIDDDQYNDSFATVQRIVACMELRQEYRQQLAEDNLE